MSANDPPQGQPPAVAAAVAANDDDDEDLVLEDQVEDTETEFTADTEDQVEICGDGPELIEVDEANEDDDDDVKVVEVERKLFTDEFIEAEKKLKEMADKFFDPESPESICNLPAETRQAVARYAAGLFEWFCCMPKPELLKEFGNLDDLNLPFPITPDRSRVLLKRDLGVRLADLWRQSKSASRMAAHFKLNEGIALMSLLDYAITNSSHDLDVVPLLRELEVYRSDYFNAGSFIIENSNPALWKAPNEFTCHLMLPPMAASLCLYILHTECLRGQQLAIPWEQFQVERKDIPADVLAELEEIVLSAREQLNTEERKENAKIAAEKHRLEFQMEAISRETGIVREQLKMGEARLEKIKVKHDELRKLRESAINGMYPDNFVDAGEALKKAEEDILVVESERPAVSQLGDAHITEALVALKEGDKVWARRKEDSIETFEEAVFVATDGTDNVQVRFASDKSTGEEKEGEGAQEAPIVTIPKTSVALKNNEINFPMFSECVRVVARARNPGKDPKKDGYYSGTIVTKFDQSRNDYLVVFDDFFDRFVQKQNIYLMAAQPMFEGKFSRARTASLVTPSAQHPVSTKERKGFIFAYSYRYPLWSLVRFGKEKMHTNVSVKHRDGSQWVAKIIAIDRTAVLLRFNPIQTYESDDNCTDYPCKKQQHVHHDEWMYRGNPRLVHVRNLNNFDHIFAQCRTIIESGGLNPSLAVELRISRDPISSRAELRRLRRANHSSGGASFEPAVPLIEIDRDEDEMKLIPPGQKVKFRKQGIGLQTELAVPLVQQKRKRYEKQLKIENHQRSWISFEGKKHDVCGTECLKGMDADVLDPKFVDYSPFYVPILCGWTREYGILSERRGGNELDFIRYRSPCGKPFHTMDDIIDFLEITRSELTIDLFTFNRIIDVTVHAIHDKRCQMLPDLTRGAEGRPLPVINEIDSENAPTFIYRARRYAQSDKIDLSTVNKEFCSGCDCTDDCRDWTKCACQRLTHRESVRCKPAFNHVTKGYDNRRLMEKVMSGVYECNENCRCSRKRCFNRVVQNEVKIPMQMMKTSDMGWGIRTLCDIPQGTFISCYQGAIMTDQVAEMNAEGDEYYADLDFYNVAESEKQNSGADMLYDDGIIVDDCGLRELTIREKNEAVKEDYVMTLRKSNKRNAEKRMKKEQEEEERAMEAEREAERERKRGGGGEVEESSQSPPKEEEGKLVKEEEEKEKVNEEEPAGDGVEAEEGGGGGGEGMEEEEDEGLGGDGASLEDEEEYEVKVKEEEEKEEEEEEDEEERKEEERRRQSERKKPVQHWVKKPTDLPLKDVTGDFAQYDLYFTEGGVTNLYTVDAKACGNLGRQFNHSCDPNMYTQHVFVDTHDIRLPWVAFFARRDIKAGEELCWDYGYKQMDGSEQDGMRSRGLKCKCGADCCRVNLL